jgi:hypothetical protein
VSSFIKPLPPLSNPLLRVDNVRSISLGFALQQDVKLGEVLTLFSPGSAWDCLSHVCMRLLMTMADLTR